MRIEFEEPLPGTAPQYAQITHRDKTVGGFSLLTFRYKTFEERENFKYINHWWDRQTLDWQDRAFAIYQDIRHQLDSAEVNQLTGEVMVEDLQMRLFSPIASFLNMHDMDEVCKWVRDHTTIHIPSSATQVFIDTGDGVNTRERTFLRHEYIQLVGLAIVLQGMIPIWGAFSDIVRNTVDGKKLDEVCADLIAASQLRDHPICHKLLTYFDEQIRVDPDDYRATMSFGSRHTVYETIFKQALLRRLALAALDTHSDSRNLATGLYMFGNTRTGDSSTAIGQAPKVKDFIKENEGAGDGAQSRLEQVQPRLDHSEGAIAVMNLQPSCVRNLVEHMPCDISLDLAEEFRQENQVWMGWNLPILPCQEYLTRWILDPAFSSMHYPYLHRDRLLNCMSVAQAWLWQNKHYQLAAILCAKPSARPRDQWTTSNCRPMSAAVEAKLALHYPYNRSTRARPTKSAKVEPHPAILGIKNIVTAFEGYKWDTLRDRQYLPLITGSSGSTTVTLPSDARDVIAEIVMYFNSFTPKHV